MSSVRRVTSAEALVNLTPCLQIACTSTIILTCILHDSGATLCMSARYMTCSLMCWDVQKTTVQPTWHVVETRSQTVSRALKPSDNAAYPRRHATSMKPHDVSINGYKCFPPPFAEAWTDLLLERHERRRPARPLKRSPAFLAHASVRPSGMVSLAHSNESASLDTSSHAQHTYTQPRKGGVTAQGLCITLLPGMPRVLVCRYTRQCR